MNRWTGIGRLVRDPEMRYSQSGTAVTKFAVAVDRKFKNAQGKKETDFIQTTTFKQLAELCANYLAKGKLVCVSGELQINSYNDKDGNKKYSTDIIADDVTFLSPKSEGQEGAPPTPPDKGSFGHEISLDDDIPF